MKRVIMRYNFQVSHYETNYDHSFFHNDSFKNFCLFYYRVVLSNFDFFVVIFKSDRKQSRDAF